MAGKYGTPMGLTYIGPKRKKKRRIQMPKASEVTITRADGTVEVKPPYSRSASVPRKRR